MRRQAGQRERQARSLSGHCHTGSRRQHRHAWLQASGYIAVQHNHSCKGRRTGQIGSQACNAGRMGACTRGGLHVHSKAAALRAAVQINCHELASSASPALPFYAARSERTRVPQLLRAGWLELESQEASRLHRVSPVGGCGRALYCRSVQRLGRLVIAEDGEALQLRADRVCISAISRRAAKSASAATNRLEGPSCCTQPKAAQGPPMSAAAAQPPLVAHWQLCSPSSSHHPPAPCLLFSGLRRLH